MRAALAGLRWMNTSTGCTVEHAGYVLTWLCAMFGRVTQLTAFADVLMPDKMDGVVLPDTPDLSTAMLRFENGVVARMSNGIYAGHDHALRLWGDEGMIEVKDPPERHLTNKGAPLPPDPPQPFFVPFCQEA